MNLRCVFLALSATIMLSPAFGATQCVRPGGGSPCFSSIQGAIDAAAPGDTVQISKGTYRENITVNKSVTLAGDNTETVVIQPAVSSPNPCTGSSLGCGESNVILVESDNVSIHDLTIDGDNPLLTSGIVRGGADLDARNGIITNHLLGSFNNLEVYHVAVRNIYLRGIYASSGGTFNFHDSSVRNVQGDYYSICMFNFGGSGVMSGNYARDCNDALSSNWSTGVQFLNNEIEHSGSGVHTDNAGSGSPTSTDVIAGNKISNGMTNGYGIFTFVPYGPVRVENNTIIGMSVGLSTFSSATPNGQTVFSGNVVDGSKIAGSVGAYVSTSEFGYGDNTVTATFNNNLLARNADGILVEATNNQTANVTGSCNELVRNSGTGIHSDLPTGTGTNNISLNAGNIAQNGVGAKNDTLVEIDAHGNWWGCPVGPGSNGCDSVIGPVNFTPALARPAICAPRAQGKND